ncbi:HHIP-like protein 2 [Glandiceps talaboti]
MASPTVRPLVALLVAFFAIFSPSAGSPKCANDVDPFKPASTLQFCTKFSEFGCCNGDADIQQQHKSIMTQLTSESCSAYVRDILCQKCSPVTSRLYENTAVKESPLPGLCAGQCHDFYAQCKEAIPLLTNDKSLLKSLESEENFCGELQRSGTEYCYPEMMDTLDARPKLAVEPKADTCVCFREIASGLHNPIAATSAFDGSNRLYVAEQTGVVHIIDGNGIMLPEPFLDISDEVVNGVFPGDERGFLSIAFHPKYDGTGKFYIYYNADTPNLIIRISEMMRDATDPNKADRSTERVLFEIDQPSNNHNGGQLLFGLDQYLYVFMGDGGGSGDPWGERGNGQNKGTFLGSAIRIDIDSELEPYGIPEDNPFIDDPEAVKELWAYGLRNPWRCSVDRGDAFEVDKGRILCADVGQNAFEEIDIIEGGGNYGWRGREGNSCYDTQICQELEGDILPIHDYGRTIGRSITGGYVYRGCDVESFYGDYIFGDYSTPDAARNLFKLIEDKESGTWSREDLCIGDAQLCTGDLTGDFPYRILSFGEDESGELYMMATDSAAVSNDGGVLLKFADPAGSGCVAQDGKQEENSGVGKVSSLCALIITALFTALLTI